MNQSYTMQVPAKAPSEMLGVQLYNVVRAHTLILHHAIHKIMHASFFRIFWVSSIQIGCCLHVVY